MAANVSEKFLEDHQAFTQAIFQLHNALKDGDDPRAFELAERLDRIGGPHIAFEEEVLYPLVADAGEPRFAEQLYTEHDEVRDAVAALLKLDPAHPVPAEAREAILAGLQTGMQHVESCGTLVSRLLTLSEQEQDEALERLLALNREGSRWTELE